MGRPKTDNSRNRSIAIRINEEEYSMMLDVQSENGASISEIIRKAIRFYYNFIKRTR